MSLAAAVLLAAAVQGGPSGGVLARYSFEDDVDTGPDTFAVFQHSKGTVSLSRAFRVSGYRALEIVDAAGDRDFPELQGYFPVRRGGRLSVHFAFLTAEPEQDWNAALAGPAHFTRGRDGIAFWLAAQEGVLVHHSDSIPKPLLRLEAFTWYAVDLAYDVGAGRYDLTIRQEGVADPVVALRGQPAAASHAGSAVDKFSFIGDLADRSRVRYYVDDVLIAAGERVTLPPFVAPGRRKLFVDAFREHDRRQGSPSCFAAALPEEIGLPLERLAALLQGPGASTLRAAFSDPARPPSATASVPELAGVRRWMEGCAALARGEAGTALAAFEDAAAAAPEAGLFELSAALALVRLGRRQEAQARLSAVERTLADDGRLAAARALAGADPYFALVADERWPEARERALARAAAAEDAPARAVWLERAADAAFLAGSVAEAGELYERSVAAGPSRSAPMLKRADVAHLLGDLASERAWREKIYGALGER